MLASIWTFKNTNLTLIRRTWIINHSLTLMSIYFSKYLLIFAKWCLLILAQCLLICITHAGHPGPNLNLRWWSLLMMSASRRYDTTTRRLLLNCSLTLSITCATNHEQWVWAVWRRLQTNVSLTRVLFFTATLQVCNGIYARNNLSFARFFYWNRMLGSWNVVIWFNRNDISWGFVRKRSLMLTWRLLTWRL